MKLARWISAGVFSLAGIAAAGEPAGTVNVPTDSKASTVPCDPCAPVCCDPCDPCCPPKPAKVKHVSDGPRKIVVHQSQPVVEFRNDAPSGGCAPAARRAPCEDRAVRPVGGEGCGCNNGGHNLFHKKHNCFQNMCGTPMPVSTQTVMTAVPMTIQAYVPQTVQTFAVQTMVAQPSTAFVAGPAAAVQGVSPLVVQLADAMTANTRANIAAAPAAAPAASAADVNAIAAKVNELDARLLRVERKLQAVCDTK